MLNSFENNQETERAGLDLIMPYIKKYYPDALFISRKDMQEYGDIVYNKNGKTILIEMKAEAADLHGNFFIETWSNLSKYNLGWIYKIKSDLLFYIFILEKKLYIIQVQDLKEWLFKKGNLYKYQERKQNKHPQLNDTWGRPIPIKMIQKDLDIKEISLGAT